MRLLGPLLVTLAAASSASATPRTAPKKNPRVYAFRQLAILGDISEKDAKTIRERAYAAVERLLSSAGDFLVPADFVDREYSTRPQLQECDTWSCNAELGSALKANRIFTLRVEQDPKEATIWRVRLATFNVDALAGAGAGAYPCERCTVEDLKKGDAIVAAIKTQISGDNPPPLCTLNVTSDPVGAPVAIDGEVYGATPFSRTIDARQHGITVQQKGYAKWDVVTDCEEGRTRKVHVTLDPVASKGTTSVVDTATKPTAQTASLRRPLLLTLGSVGVVAGIALLGGGAATIAKNGDPACDRAPGERLCAQRYASLPPGIGMAVTGGVLLAAGIAAFAVEAVKHRDEHRRTISVAPWLTPSTLGLSIGGKL